MDCCAAATASSGRLAGSPLLVTTAVMLLDVCILLPIITDHVIPRLVAFRRAAIVTLIELRVQPSAFWCLLPPPARDACRRLIRRRKRSFDTHLMTVSPSLLHFDDDLWPPSHSPVPRHAPAFRARLRHFRLRHTRATSLIDRRDQYMTRASLPPAVGFRDARAAPILRDRLGVRRDALMTFQLPAAHLFLWSSSRRRWTAGLWALIAVMMTGIDDVATPVVSSTGLPRTTSRHRRDIFVYVADAVFSDPRLAVRLDITEHPAGPVVARNYGRCTKRTRFHGRSHWKVNEEVPLRRRRTPFTTGFLDRRDAIALVILFSCRAELIIAIVALGFQPHWRF